MASLLVTLACIASLSIPAVICLIFSTGKFFEYQDAEQRREQLRLSIDVVSGVLLLSGCLAFMAAFYGSYVGSILELTGTITGIVLTGTGAIGIIIAVLDEELNVF